MEFREVYNSLLAGENFSAFSKRLQSLQLHCRSFSAVSTTGHFISISGPPFSPGNPPVWNIIGELSSRLLSWIGSATSSAVKHLPKRETWIAEWWA